MLARQHGGQTGEEKRGSTSEGIDRTRPIEPPREFSGRSLMKKRVLVVDVGGTYIKLLMSRCNEREFGSGRGMRPQQLIAKLKENVRGWKSDVASIGFPAPVRKGRIMKDPKHLGKGWIGFNFNRALGAPVRLINDAAMQALGSYRGGRMLFLGLGTGVGQDLDASRARRPAVSRW